MLKKIHVLIPVALVFMSGAVAEAQLFGSRTLGQPLQRRVGPSRFSQAGELQGSERFLRGNRGRADFVGSDQREQRGFVGNEQARGTGAVVTSTAGLRERPDRGSQINRPLTLPEAGEMYHPRLRLGFVLPKTSLTDLGHRLTEELSASARFSEQCRLVVSVAGRTAILQGEVTSVRERDLAELVALVGQGISQVRNELKVVTVRVLPESSVPSEDSSSEP